MLLSLSHRVLMTGNDIKNWAGDILESLPSSMIVLLRLTMQIARHLSF